MMRIHNLLQLVLLAAFLLAVFPSVDAYAQGTVKDINEISVEEVMKLAERDTLIRDFCDIPQNAPIDYSSGMRYAKGKVTSNGEPLGRVKLIFHGIDDAAEVHSGFSQSDGSFCMYFQTPGKVKVQATLEGYVEYSNIIDLSEEAPFQLDIDLLSYDEQAQQGTVTGFVNNGLSRVPVMLTSVTEQSRVYTRITDEDGRFYFFPIPQGEYKISACSHMLIEYEGEVKVIDGVIVEYDITMLQKEFENVPFGRAQQKKELNNPCEEYFWRLNDKINQTLSETTRYEIYGDITSQGKPVTGVKVSLKGVNNPNRQYFTISSEEGEYIFPDVGEGVYWISVQKDGFVEDKKGVRAKDNPFIKRDFNLIVIEPEVRE